MSTGTVASLWRHPIKSHGREEVTETVLSPGKPMPYDRLWAVAHERSSADGSTWVPCQNFSRVAKAPSLMAIRARLDEANGTVTLSHPERDDLTFDPDREGDRLIAWAEEMIPENRARSARVIRALTNGFTDSDFPSVTLCNAASHRAVEQRVGQSLSPERWRGNIWIDGLGPWEEFEWTDHEVRIGEAVLRVRERTDRCLSTHANPETGRRDADVLPALDSWGHRDFSVRAEVLQGGAVRQGDPVERL